ncbi:dihydrodipicolinate synthase family protein [Castellaniella sp.]|uniref:dihydrodipicolinate synthase family protein n=1 Tax=Castellaniella sp. TaxID=1955812 RepID=UPI003C725443
MHPSFEGIFASTVVPMQADERIDFDALARHHQAVTSRPGIRGLLINGHAGENFTLTAQEKQDVVRCAREAVGPKAQLICGVYAESSAEAADQARQAQAAGADALLVFPPFSWALGHTTDSALAHHRAIRAQTRLPLMLYQASVHAGRMAYSPDTLAALARLEGVVAIKEGSWETARYEANLRHVQAAAPHVGVMPSGDEHLLSTFLLGGSGSQVSIAALDPDAVVQLWDSVRQGDIAQARKAHARLYPLVKAIYGAAPGTRATARLKTCLHLRGLIPTPAMRAPMTASDPAETQWLQSVLNEADL